MNAKEVKAALANEHVQAAVEKEVTKAVKAKVKHILDLIKSIELPDDKNEAKVVKEALKDIVAGIKEVA